MPHEDHHPAHRRRLRGGVKPMRVSSMMTDMRPFLNDGRARGAWGAAILALMTVLSFAYGSPLRAEPAPNFVFLLADDMNRDSWGVYGAKDCKTPHIDRLARDGVRFDRAYFTVAMCSPARQELYSGRSPWRTGTLPNHSRSTPDTRSLAHYLNPLGYRVALLGKRDIGPAQAYPFEYPSEGGANAEDPNDRFIGQATRFIESCTGQNTPFCLFIASSDSHEPYTSGDPSIYDAKALTIPPYWLDTQELREQLVRYYAEVTHFDALVGAVRHELESRGLWKNTVLMVCSEQGTSMPFAKWTCYDNGLRTGLVAHWPGAGTPGAVIEELISMADIAPTLLEAAGGTPASADFDGRSILGIITGGGQAGRAYVYGAFTNCNIAGNGKRIYPIRSIRTTDFSLLYNPHFQSQTSNIMLMGALDMLGGREPSKRDVGTSWVELSRQNPGAEALVHKLHHRPEWELYDLRCDPLELTNQIANPAYQTVAEHLKNQLRRKLAELGDPDPVATEKSLVKAAGAPAGD